MTIKFLIALLVAYLGWRLWRGPARRPRPAMAAPQPAAMSDALRDELSAARALLGVAPGASEADIRAAHRRLMADAHPDHGGTTEQARRLNLARDALLRALNP